MIYEEKQTICVRLSYDPASVAFKNTWEEWLAAHPDPILRTRERMLDWVAGSVLAYWMQNHGDELTHVHGIGSLLPRHKGFSGIQVEYCGYTSNQPGHEC